MNPTTTPKAGAVADVAAKLTEAQRAYVNQHRPNEQRMGGYGKDCGCPGLIESRGIHHPIFGAHYRLTPLGMAVRQHLEQGATADE